MCCIAGSNGKAIKVRLQLQETPIKLYLAPSPKTTNSNNSQAAIILRTSFSHEIVKAREIAHVTAK